jgi:hypothetical protein
VIQLPSIGDVLPYRNVVVIVNTSFIRILFLPKYDD